MHKAFRMEHFLSFAFGAIVWCSPIRNRLKNHSSRSGDLMFHIGQLALYILFHKFIFQKAEMLVFVTEKEREYEL